jgi:hypothetical protein
VPVGVCPGFHRRADARSRPDPDLRLIHLHRADYDVCRARHRVRARRAWAARDSQEGWGRHHFIVDEPDFSRWFYDGATPLGATVTIEEIPPAWRAVV